MGKAPKKTRRAAFLEQTALVVPWSQFEQLIAPHYPVAGRVPRPYPLRVMLKIHFMQQWFGLSDPAMEEALWETPLLRKFAGIRLDFEGVPDETTILKFRHLLEKHELGKALFDEMAALLTERGLLLRQGTLVDATLIAAPPSTKNNARSRDPEMKQTKKGNQWHFGMKVHVGADVTSGCVHSAEMTSANVHDSVVTDTLLHGEEDIAFGDSAYGSRQDSLEADREESDVVWAIPFKRKKAQGLTEEQPADVFVPLQGRARLPDREAPVRLHQDPLSRPLQEQPADFLPACVDQYLHHARGIIAIARISVPKQPRMPRKTSKQAQK
jgi:transposase, IS5 family